MSRKNKIFDGFSTNGNDTIKNVLENSQQFITFHQMCGVKVQKMYIFIYFFLLLDGWKDIVLSPFVI